MIHKDKYLGYFLQKMHNGSLVYIDGVVCRVLKTGRTKRAGRITSKGYVQLVNSVDGKEMTCVAHRLVYAYFSGEPLPEHLEVNHLNGVKTDNRIENLELVTSAENNRHAFSTGLKTPRPISGESNPSAKLTVEEARAIRADTTSTNIALGKQYGVTDVAVSLIRRGVTWVDA